MEAARAMLVARAQARRLAEGRVRAEPPNAEEQAAARERAEGWERWFHASFALTDAKLELVRRVREAALEPLELELLLALLLTQLGMSSCFHSTADLVDGVRRPDTLTLAALRALGDSGRLVRAGLIRFKDPEEDLAERTPVAAPELAERLLQGEGEAAPPLLLPVDSQPEFLESLEGLTELLVEKMRELGGGRSASGLFGSRASSSRSLDPEERGSREDHVQRKVERIHGRVLSTLRAHRDWPLSKLLLDPAAELEDEDLLVVLALAGRELGHRDCDHALYRGLGLAQAVAPRRKKIQEALQRLSPRGVLVRRKLIGAADGLAELLPDDPATLAETGFELGEKARAALELEKLPWRNERKDEDVRQPRVRLSQLCLPDRVRKVLRLAVVQARHAEVLLGAWGLGKTIAYGRAVTLLFSGPPGVGKTAAAEGLAQALGRPILVADYAEIQNCFVGQTEKNIAAIFQRARRARAVLFWDEADAMFYDRGMGQRTWEVRDVNVLLTELERFEGVCVLATNRAGSLDAALERRITLKVEFEPPDRDARERIWRLLLPRKLPLAKDVDFTVLAQAGLTGGEIKNAVLNAARMALLRGARTRVRMADLEAAVRLELDGRLGREKNRPLGFHAGGG